MSTWGNYLNADLNRKSGNTSHSQLDASELSYVYICGTYLLVTIYFGPNYLDVLKDPTFPHLKKQNKTKTKHRNIISLKCLFCSYWMWDCEQFIWTLWVSFLFQRVALVSDAHVRHGWECLGQRWSLMATSAMVSEGQQRSLVMSWLVDSSHWIVIWNLLLGKKSFWTPEKSHRISFTCRVHE